MPAIFYAPQSPRRAGSFAHCWEGARFKVYWWLIQYVIFKIFKASVEVHFLFKYLHHKLFYEKRCIKHYFLF